jgi:predicted SnoaL-like aldol condensation-catalyzing enzyme
MSKTTPQQNKALVLEAFETLFSGIGRPAAWTAADIVRFEDGKFAEHWDVLQDEATRTQSISGLPMFGERFPE